MLSQAITAATNGYKRKVLPHKDRKIDIGRALEMRLRHGLTYEEIGKLLGARKQTIHALLQRWLPLLHQDGNSLASYQQNRVSLFTAVEQELLSDLLDGDKRQKASLNNVAYAFQQIHTARRLEEGKSTSNVNVAEIHASLDELRSKRTSLEAELQALRA